MLYKIGISAALAVMLTLGAVVVASWQLVSALRDAVSANQASLSGLSAAFDRAFPTLEETVRALSGDVDRARRSDETSGEQIRLLQERLQELQMELSEARAAQEGSISPQGRSREPE